MTPQSFLSEAVNRVLAAGTGDWITVYGDGFTAGLIPESQVQRVLASDGWAVDPSRLMPGCVRYGDGRIVYYRFGTGDGFEPLILARNFHGLRPSDIEISDEFRFFHNLYHDPKSARFIKIKPDGAEVDVVRLENGTIRIRSIEIKQFLAIKEMRLGLFFDLQSQFRASLSSYGASPQVQRESGPDFSYTRVVSAHPANRNHSFVRLYGCKVIAGFAKENSGCWPYSERGGEDREFMAFVVGTDDSGGAIRVPCDPEGAKYLTPVYFSSEVLNRYYDNPGKYSVEDGYLRCGGLWGVRIDNDAAGLVTVFLGDIGRDIPESEHGHWQTFNIAPDGGLSETAVRRNFLAEFAGPTSPELIFKRDLRHLEQQWRAAHGWDLLLPLSEGDAHCIASLRIPATEEQGEFDRQIGYLAKVLVDSINEAEIAKHVTESAGQKGIGKLEAFLAAKGVPEPGKTTAILRQIQELRSTGAAHKKGGKYEKAANAVGLNERNTSEVFSSILLRAATFLAAMRSLCASDNMDAPPEGPPPIGGQE